MNNEKSRAVNSALYQTFFAGGKNNSFDAVKYKHYVGLGQRCLMFQTDDLKHAVENSVGIFCRRCEHHIEFIRCEHPYSIALFQNEPIRRCEV